MSGHQQTRTMNGNVGHYQHERTINKQYQNSTDTIRSNRSTVHHTTFKMDQLDRSHKQLIVRRLAETCMTNICPTLAPTQVSSSAGSVEYVFEEMHAECMCESRSFRCQPIIQLPSMCSVGLCGHIALDTLLLVNLENQLSRQNIQDQRSATHTCLKYQNNSKFSSIEQS